MHQSPAQVVQVVPLVEVVGSSEGHRLALPVLQSVLHLDILAHRILVVEGTGSSLQGSLAEGNPAEDTHHTLQPVVGCIEDYKCPRRGHAVVPQHLQHC